MKTARIKREWLVVLVVLLGLIPERQGIFARPQDTPQIIIVPDPADESIIRARRTTPAVVVLGPVTVVTNPLPENATAPFIFTNAGGFRATNFAFTPLTNLATTNSFASFLTPATNLAVAPITNAVPALVPGLLIPSATGRQFPPLQPGTQIIPPEPTIVPPLRPPASPEPAVPPLRSPNSPPAVPPLPGGGTR